VKVVDLFSGTGSATQAFVERGHDVVTVELDKKFGADVISDVRDVTTDLLIDLLGGDPDFVWASPPCTSYSVGSFRHHWKATAPCRPCGGSLLRVSGEQWDHEEGGCDTPRPGPMTYQPKSDTGHLGQ